MLYGRAVDGDFMSSQTITLMHSVYKTIPTIHQLRHKTPEKSESRGMIATEREPIAYTMVDFIVGGTSRKLLEVAINQAQCSHVPHHQLNTILHLLSYVYNS